MVDDRVRFGPLVSALGAALLGVSVFLPWYALSLTANGAAAAQQSLDSAAQEYGNTTLQDQASSIGAQFNAFAGRQLATLSAHQVLKDIGPVLLILAAIALLATLLRLAGVSTPIETDGGQIALVGIAATLCVLFRIVDPPARQQAFFSLSLGWGIWLALAGSLAIVAGGLWPTSSGRAAGASADERTSAPPAPPALPDLTEYWRG
jgi:hypothetical protein